jgi:plastocyanin
MLLDFSRVYVMIHLFAVLALGIAPFVFFSVYADDTQNEWKITIPDGASNQDLQIGMYPNELPVKVGDTIIWENEDSVPHSITSGLPTHPEFAGMFFNPGNVEPGKSVSQVLLNSDFNSFYYFCEIHPWLTGNIFVSNATIAQPETNKPVITDKKSYSYGDTITFSGKVHQDFAKTDYTSLIYNQNNDLVYISEGIFDDKASYRETVITKGDEWDKNGNYKIKIVYAVPSKVAQTTIQFSNESFLSDYKKTIPAWIKNVSGFWCSGQISNTEFIDAVQYLINEDVIQLKKIESGISNSQQVPEWVKNNACWWADDKIPDLDFISGIEYLVNIGTISV